MDEYGFYFPFTYDDCGIGVGAGYFVPSSFDDSITYDQINRFFNAQITLLQAQVTALATQVAALTPPAPAP